MITSPQNNIVVKVKTKYISNITDLLKRSAIQNNASIDPLDFVNITGEVVSVPKSILNRFDYDGYSVSDIEVGDTAIFSYAVIGDTETIEDGKIKFKNRLWHNGEEYFLCNITNIYGVIRGGNIIMVNGWVMTTIFDHDRILLPASMKKIKGVVRCKVLAINNPKSNKKKIEASVGDTVLFNPLIGQLYQINDKPFIIVSQSHILAKEL
jgi:co-chaperonin GroES (HSP10)